jgi:serine O-acetyltransferase
MFDPIREDLARCHRKREILLNPATWAVMSYRFRRWILRLGVPSMLKWPLWAIGALVDLLSRIASGIELPTRAVIGPGLYIPHTGYVVVGAGARIGQHCTLCQGVTIGHARGGRDKRGGCPVIGDRVYVGPGSAIIGPIEIGNDALIGPGAIVVKSVPAAGVAVGNPARVISYAGSFDLISYPEMESDVERIAALTKFAGSPSVPTRRTGLAS